MAGAGKSLLHGTLETLALKALSHGPLHGYGVARWIEDTTDEDIRVEEGSLYPALYRMEKDGLLRTEWGVSDLGRRAKMYHLTDRGVARLERAGEDLLAFTRAVQAILAS